MDYHRLYRELRTELREWVREYTSTFIKLLPYTKSSSSGDNDQVRGYPTEGADEQPYDYQARRVWPFGIRSVPPAGVLAIWIGNRGRSGNGAIIGAESSRFGPSDLKDGEVAIYNKVTGCLVKLDVDGNITIDTPAGKKVTIQGGTKGAARIDDDLSASTAMKTWAKGVEDGIASAGGTPPATTFSAGAGGAGALGTIHSGSGKTNIG